MDHLKKIRSSFKDIDHISEDCILVSSHDMRCRRCMHEASLIRDHYRIEVDLHNEFFLNVPLSFVKEQAILSYGANTSNPPVASKNA